MPTHTYVDQNLATPIVLSTAVGNCVVYSHRSPEKDTANEDAAAIIPGGSDSAVLAVADGCGGSVTGEEAARITIETLCTSIQNAASDEDPMRVAILDAIEKANQTVRQLGTGAATTLSVVEVGRATVRPYHVGDTMILVVGSRGKIKLQTNSHSPVGYAVAAGLLDEQEALHHDELHLVSNVIGAEDSHVEVGSHRDLASLDTVLIASDGLADNLHLSEIVEIIRKGPLEKAAQRLVDVATERMNEPKEGIPSKPDDLTFVLYRPRWE